MEDDRLGTRVFVPLIAVDLFLTAVRKVTGAAFFRACRKRARNNRVAHVNSVYTRARYYRLAKIAARDGQSGRHYRDCGRRIR